MSAIHDAHCASTSIAFDCTNEPTPAEGLRASSDVDCVAGSDESVRRESAIVLVTRTPPTDTIATHVPLPSDRASGRTHDCRQVHPDTGSRVRSLPGPADLLTLPAHVDRATARLERNITHHAESGGRRRGQILNTAWEISRSMPSVKSIDGNLASATGSDCRARTLPKTSADLVRMPVVRGIVVRSAFSDESTVPPVGSCTRVRSVIGAMREGVR